MPVSVSYTHLAKVLKKIDDIGFCQLTSKDVVRHPLVQQIVQAYEDYVLLHNQFVWSFFFLRTVLVPPVLLDGFCFFS